MNIIGNSKAYTENIVLEGRLDANGAADFEKYFQKINPILREVVLDLSGLEYISSMGLRVILQAYKALNKHRKKLTIINIPDNIRAIFEMSGFIQAFVKEEKFVLIEKEQQDNRIVYVLAGTLDASTGPMLETVLRKAKADNLGRVHLLCKDMDAMNREGFTALRYLRDNLLSRHCLLTIEDVPEKITQEAAKLGASEFLTSLLAVKKPGEAEKIDSGNDNEHFIFKGAWGTFQIPAFDAAWRKEHPKAKKVIIDIAAVTGVTPEHLSALLALKQRCVEQGLAVDLVM